MIKNLLLVAGFFLLQVFSANAQCLDKSVSGALRPSINPIEFFKAIENQIQCSFAYNLKLLKKLSSKEFEFKDKPLFVVLDSLFSNTEISYVERNQQILIFQPKTNKTGETLKSIGGFLLDSVSKEPLVNAKIYLDNKVTVSSDKSGYFSLYIEQFPVEIAISHSGYETKVIMINDTSIRLLQIRLNAIKLLDEVLVKSIKKTNFQLLSNQNATMLSAKEIKDIPAMFGEKDAMRALQLLPGVSAPIDGLGGLNVRGGSPDQNLVLVDEATMYNAYHLFGLFSFFNPNTLSEVKLHKGNFPARYGGRLSSVINMSMREGDKNSFHGEAGLGFISSKLLLEGPILKEKVSFLLSARRTYLDLLIKPFFEKDFNLGYYFYDVNSKITWNVDTKNKISLSFNNGSDRFYLNQTASDYTLYAGLNWGNTATTLNWQCIVAPNWVLNTSLIYSDYKLKIISDETFANAQKVGLRFLSGIRDFQVKQDIAYYASNKHHLKAGYSAILHMFTPSATIFRDDYAQFVEESVFNYFNTETAIYLEDDWHVSNAIQLSLGIRASKLIAQDTFPLRPEPRLHLRYRFNKRNSFQLGGSVMNQYVHLLSNTGIGIPSDLWVPATKNLPNQFSRIASLGYVHDFRNGFQFSADAYLKQSDNVLTYKDGASFLSVNTGSSAKIKREVWEQNITAGNENASGLEFLLRKHTGILTGWLSYTRSKTMVQFDEINQGRAFFSRYDRRNDFSLVLVYAVSKKLKASAVWRYATGNAITPPVAQHYSFSHQAQINKQSSFLNGFVTNVYGERNSIRMPDYHRLDLSLSYEHKIKKWAGQLELSLYNVYNRQNPFFYFISRTGASANQNNVLNQVTLFPFIPSLNYTVSF